MRTETAPTIRLSEYTPPSHLADSVHLTFQLDPTATRVQARITFRPNPAHPSSPADLWLDGVALTLHNPCIDGNPVPDAALTHSPSGLTIAATALPDRPFVWTCETVINPQGNTALEGLYMSRDMYCTQCEAEGFRKITYYPDRPDVMSVFTVRIEGSSPVLLSNGNPTASGEGFAEWHDPWPKPAYLFALVAGDLVSFDDRFETASGRDVALKIYVRPGDEDQCAYAMDALKRSMLWDEQAYGREYDLDLFMIVAVDDFNMGAMENKGLNVFNSKYVLARPDTATDTDYALIEGIIAHEYFHNWTGNRITCRDWFQLCLKEGLTVFRDQQFSGDMRSEAVQRISDALALRARQFREDAGPLAHPVRPEEYQEINNFYTATVYEKGAELIRMLRGIVGPEAYRAALDLYFDRHDGEACTIEDWLAVFTDATGHDLSHFALWYSQAGTPHVTVTDSYANGTYTLSFDQKTAPTPGQPHKQPQYIPISYGFLDQNGQAMGSPGMLTLTESRQSFSFDLPSRPVPSLLRGFSAPIVLNFAQSRADHALLLAHDSDPFNRAEAARRLGMDVLVDMVAGSDADPLFLDAMAAIAGDNSADPAFRALALALPSEDEIAAELHGRGIIPNPANIHTVRHKASRSVASRLGPMLDRLFAEMDVAGPYSPAAEPAGKRALRLRALSLMMDRDGPDGPAAALFASADNMTESLAALGCLISANVAGDALSAFHSRWKDNPNVLDKWFALQAARSNPADALDAVKNLSEHTDFTWKTPNRFRSLLGGFAQNHAGFHRDDGAGYALYCDWLLRLDPLNPQIAARMITAFETWARYDTRRQDLMKAQMDRIAASPNLSRDTTEMITRIRGD